ncbi:hypothetical protein [Natranaeroarchaeum sulfidigenes]|uniref:hypothetical protein n=1 Tax=Natranaeroarchaeum sulfidigenes TaxID=2784880 RepID=UPI001EE5FCF1|nr:hypothetical protein [Natranaeroarchaeum sulfidigenes]
MPTRRQLLSACGVASLSAGCLSAHTATTGDLILLNRMEEQTAATVEIEQDGESVFADTYEIDAGTRPEPTEVVEPDVFEGTNGTSYSVSVTHMGHEHEFGYSISCADRETADVLYIELYGEHDVERERSRCG